MLFCVSANNRTEIEKKTVTSVMIYRLKVRSSRLISPLLSTQKVEVETAKNMHIISSLIPTHLLVKQ